VQARRWWMLGVTCLSVIVINLDLTILNIALPAISAALHADTGDLQWLVDAYTLVFAGVMLPAGMLGDRLGRKRLLLAGLAVFLAASLWCALSVSVGELIAARALMGLGAGIVFPLSLAVVSAAFGDADRPKAIGILTAGIALGLPLGPVLGGVLLQHFSWHSVFWINVPAACVTLAAGAVTMPLLTYSSSPAARLLAPRPRVDPSMRTTRPTPLRRRKYAHQAPTVPPPTTSASAVEPPKTRPLSTDPTLA